FPVPVVLSKNGTCLARIMIAVVTKKDDFSADLLLQPASRRNFSEQESFGKKSARLLAETNNRVIHRSEEPSYPGGSFCAAKDSLLQDRGENQYRDASDEIVPEITNARRAEEKEDEPLRN